MPLFDGLGDEARTGLGTKKKVAVCFPGPLGFHFCLNPTGHETWRQSEHDCSHPSCSMSSQCPHPDQGLEGEAVSNVFIM